ncbi:MAG: MucB/RseB C-terminal domain-containing protein [Oceanospirillaceae bacterium]|nr:MucB/RseB C-terminal domain-containing protein [Oceanospirillaceae bacterium]
MRKIALLILLSCSAASFAEQQSLTGQGWYQRMVDDAPKANYKGVFIHQAGDQSQSVEIVHGEQDGKIYERMLHLDGPAREVIRQGDDMISVAPNGKAEKLSAHQAGPFGRSNLGEVEQIEKGYDFSLQESHRVAGRDAVLLQLIPRDHFRNGYRLWLDKQTAVPLRTELVDAAGRVLERFQFGQFQPLAEFDENAFVASIRKTDMAENIQESAKTSDADKTVTWQLNWLPKGFMQIQGGNNEQPGDPHRRMYSDGVVMFSVFVDDEHTGMPDGNQRIGATSVSVHHKLWLGQARRITVVGELPQEATQRIAHSVELMQ